MSALYRAPTTAASILLYSDFSLMIVCSIRRESGRMNQRDLRQFCRLLDEKLVELLAEADRTVDGVTDSKEYFQDTTDRGSIESNRNFMLRIQMRELMLFVKINVAL